MQGMRRREGLGHRDWERAVAWNSALQTGQLWRRLAWGLKERFRSMELENKPHLQLGIVMR